MHRTLKMIFRITFIIIVAITLVMASNSWRERNRIVVIGGPSTSYCDSQR